jgi:eukaryotic-like serine/threonine-protein kinase
MNLTPGVKLGPYEIVALLGAGGMGEVYRARDSRLKREVAIKVLPRALSLDADRLRRFEQEALATAALNHPNILAVFDIGTSEGSPYVVSELLEGETLRDRLRSGSIAVRKALDYALQITRGLAAAHEKGIIHRDLKPENLFLTKDGRVKILDFGLAKLTQAQAEPGVHTSPPTVTHGTEAGMVLGTAGYMSPEQVRGIALDARSDIFSFGAILYEMFSGKRAFHGDTPADTMSSILKEDPPDLTETNRIASPALERIVRHCLEKNLEERFQSARDIVFDLESLTVVSSGAMSPLAAVARFSRRWVWALAMVTILVLAALAWRIVPGLLHGTPAEFIPITFRNGHITTARFAPDGQAVFFSAAWQSEPMAVYSASRSNVVGQSLGLNSAELLSVSRNGELAVLLSQHTIYAWERIGVLARVSATGGGAKPEIDNIGDADWLPDGSALAIARYLPEQKTFRIEYPVGTVLYETQGWLSHMRFSPDGTRIAFLEHPTVGDDLGWVSVVDLHGTRKVLSPTYTAVQGVAWTPSGKEVWYTSADLLLAAGLSGNPRIVLRMPGRLLLEDIGSDGVALIRAGDQRPGLVALAPGQRSERDISWLDWPVLHHISADGKTIVFDEDGAGGYSVFMRGTDGSPALKLGHGYGMAIAPDGHSVLAVTVQEPKQLVLLPTGAGESRQISHDSIDHLGGQFFPNGKRVVFAGQEPGHAPRTYVQELDGAPPRAITPEGTWGYLLSPDGMRVLVYKNGTPMIWGIEAGDGQSVNGFESGETLLGWSLDGRLYVGSKDAAGWQIAKLDVVSGQRQPWKTISYPPLPGFGIRELVIAPDGNAYAYRYMMQFAHLYTVKGLR